jgi:hypothetical protein
MTRDHFDERRGDATIINDYTSTDGAVAASITVFLRTIDDALTVTRISLA